jgi:hypothetical protein
MHPQTRQKLKEATTQFYDSLCDQSGDFYQYWLDGFANVIVYDETNHDDDNPYLADCENAQYVNYKRGATAAIQLLKAIG